MQDEFLHTRLSLRSDLSLVEQDLEFLSDVSSSHHDDDQVLVFLLHVKVRAVKITSSLLILPGAGRPVKQPSLLAAGRLAEARGRPGLGAAQPARVEAGGGGQGGPRGAGQGQAWRHMAGWLIDSCICHLVCGIWNLHLVYSIPSHF